ncbi:hypothetical protein ACIQI8_44290 [Streptomyces sp. NPDC092369]|uniref:hypothetical protein n=1 Tax=Streptomyces sp. NPDC092369 TaxID=3366015 RepID=UPI003821FD75
MFKLQLLRESRVENGDRCRERGVHLCGHLVDDEFVVFGFGGVEDCGGDVGGLVQPAGSLPACIGVSVGPA